MIRFIAPSLRIGGIPILAVAFIGVILEPRNGGVRFDSEVHLPLLLLAYAFPLAIWWGAPFRSPPYHLSMPVPRPLNHLARAAGGLLCLLAMVFVVLLGEWVIASVTGGEMAVYRTGSGDYVAVPGWFRVTPIVAATVAYAFGTALMIGTKHPIIWGLVSFYVPAIMMEFAENTGTPGNRPLGWLDSWANGPFGFVPVLTGMTRSGGVAASHPAISAWLTSAVTWSVIAAFALAFALRRHRDS